MTLAGAEKSGGKEQRWDDEDVDLTASGSIGEDVMVEIKLSPEECQKELQFVLFRGDVPMPSDRYQIQTRGNVVQLTLKQSQKDDSGHYALVAKKLSTGLSISNDDRLESRHKIRLSIQSPSSVIDESEPPIFLRRLSDLAVKVGTRTRFLVEIRSSTSPKVTWHKNDEPVQSGSRLSSVHEGNFYCVDVAPVMVEDQGHWTCMAENGGGRSSCTSFLTVIVPKAYKKPEFVEELRALLTETGTVSLECKVVGVPTPVLKWFKDQKEIKAGDVFALTANPDDPTSLGTYTCEAVNCMGTTSSSSRVHVMGKGSREGSLKPADALTPSGPLPVFQKILRDQSCRIGDSLVLSCQVDVPPWPKTITWYNKEGRVEPSEKYHLIADGLGGYSIEIKGVEAMDEGEWKCVATSAENMKQFSTCHVAMSIPKNYRMPRFMESLKAVLTEEGLVSFECKVVGFPTPLLRWFKDGQELHPGDVYQLTGTNSLGSYCCIARNCMGEAKSIAELTVEDIQNQLNEEERMQLMSSNQAPKFVKGLRSCEARINEDFTFSIQVSVSPEPSLSWYRDDVAIIESEKYRLAREALGTCNLEVKKLEFMDQAEWKCIAANDFGHSVTSCFLKLIIPKHFKKPKFLESLRAILSEEGAVNLECKVIGVPQPILKWYKDGVELKPGDIHRIISGQDGTCCLGTYTCEATNCMGSVSSSASLLGFEDRVSVRKEEAKEPPTPLHELARNLSLSTIHEERTSQLYDTPQTDHSITMDDRGEVSFSFDGKEVSVSLYETPDLTEEEALQIVEMYADQLSEHITEGNVIELPPMRFTKETSTMGNLLMEAVVIDVSPDYFIPDEEGDDLRTEADVEDVSIMDDQMHSIRSLSYVSSPTAEASGERVPSGSPPSRPPRRKESRESFSSRSEKSEKSLPKGFDWSESYHSAKEPSMQGQFSLQGQDDSGEAFTDALSSSGPARSKAEDPRDICASLIEQNIERIPLDEATMEMYERRPNRDEGIATQVGEALIEEVPVKRRKKKRDKQSAKGSRTSSISSKASSEESYSLEVGEEKGRKRGSKNGKDRRGSTSSNKSGRGVRSRSGSDSGKFESAASGDHRRRGSDATIMVDDFRVEQIEEVDQTELDSKIGPGHGKDNEALAEKTASAIADVSTGDSERSMTKTNKERLLDNVYKLSEPVICLRNALVDIDSLLSLLRTQGNAADVERSRIELAERIVVPVENLCEQVSAIETKALKSAGDRSLAQTVRISLLEAISGPTEELLRGIELIRSPGGQQDSKSSLIVLESLTDPVDEILVGLTRIEQQLISRESSGSPLVQMEKPIALERMFRAVLRLGQSVGQITEKKVAFGDESTRCSVIERLQSVYQSLEAFLSTVPLSETTGALENNVDTLVVETLVRPLEELSRNLNTFGSANVHTQNEQDTVVGSLEKSMIEMRRRLEALIVALDTYEQESGEQGITELHADLVKFLTYTMDDAVERLEKMKLKKTRVTQGPSSESSIVPPSEKHQRPEAGESASESAVESSEPEETNVLEELVEETAAIMKTVAVPAIAEAVATETKTQSPERSRALLQTTEKSSVEMEEDAASMGSKNIEPSEDESLGEVAQASSKHERKNRKVPELDTALSLPEMLLDPLIDVQANLSDVISDFESQESAEESSLPGGSELAACLAELRESVATAAHTATTLKSANTVDALVDLREPLLDLQLAMASAATPEEVKLIREATVPLAELRDIVGAAINSAQASEASQIQMQSVLRMLEEIEADVLKPATPEATETLPVNVESLEIKRIPTRPPEEVERAAVALTGVHFAISSALERATSIPNDADDLPSSQREESSLQIAEQSGATNLINSIEGLRQSVGNLAVAIGSPVLSKENSDQYNYEVLFDELAKLEEPLLNLQKVLLTEEHGPEDRHILNDVATPIRSLKEVVQDMTREIGGEPTLVVLELIEDVEKDVTLIAMEALKKALAPKSATSDNDGRASISSLSKPGEVSPIISKWLDPIEDWLTSAAEETTEISENGDQSSIVPAIENLKRELLKIAIQTSYSEPPSDVALIEELTELQEPLTRLCEVLKECHEPENLDVIEGLKQPTKHLLGTILDASLVHEAGKVLRPVLEAIEELENQIPLTIQRATYERELQRVVRSMTPEEPETLMAEDIPDASSQAGTSGISKIHDSSPEINRIMMTGATQLVKENEEMTEALSQNSKPLQDKVEETLIPKSVTEHAKASIVDVEIAQTIPEIKVEVSEPEISMGKGTCVVSEQEGVQDPEKSDDQGPNKTGVAMQEQKSSELSVGGETSEKEFQQGLADKEMSAVRDKLQETGESAGIVGTESGKEQEYIGAATGSIKTESEMFETMSRPGEQEGKTPSSSQKFQSETIEVITVDTRPFSNTITPLESAQNAQASAADTARADQLDLWTLTLLGPLDRLGNAVLSLDRSIDELAHGLLCRPLDSLHKQIEIAESQFNRPSGQSLENDVETIIEGFLSPVNQLHTALSAAVDVWNDEQPRVVVRDLLRSIADSSTELCELLGTLRQKLSVQRANQLLQEQQEDASLVETINAVIAPLDDVRNLIEEALKRLEFIDPHEKLETDHSSTEDEHWKKTGGREISEGETIHESRDLTARLLEEKAQNVEGAELAKASTTKPETSASPGSEDIFVTEELEDTSGRQEGSEKSEKAREVTDDSFGDEVLTTKPKVGVAPRRGSKVKEDSMDIEETTAKPLEELIEAIVDSSGPRHVSSSPESEQSMTLEFPKENIKTSKIRIAEEITGGADVENITELGVESSSEDRAKILGGERLSKVEVMAGPEIGETARQAVMEILAKATQASIAEISGTEKELQLKRHAEATEDNIQEEVVLKIDDLQNGKAKLLAGESLVKAEKGKSLMPENLAVVSQESILEGNTEEVLGVKLVTETGHSDQTETLATAVVVDAPETKIKTMNAELLELVAEAASEDVQELSLEEVKKRKAGLGETASLKEASVSGTPETKVKGKDAKISELAPEYDEGSSSKISLEKIEHQQARVLEPEDVAKAGVTEAPEIKIMARTAESAEVATAEAGESLLGISSEKIDPQMAEIRGAENLAEAVVTDSPEVKIKARDAELLEMEQEIAEESLINIPSEKMEQQKADLREEDSLAEAGATGAPETKINARAAKVSELEQGEAAEDLQELPRGEEQQKAELREGGSLNTGKESKAPEVRLKEVSQTSSTLGESVQELPVEKPEQQKADLRETESYLEAKIINVPEQKIEASDADDVQSVWEAAEGTVAEIPKVEPEKGKGKLKESEGLAKAIVDTPRTTKAGKVSSSEITEENLQEMPKEKLQTQKASIRIEDLHHTAQIAKIEAAELTKMSQAKLIDAGESSIVEIVETPTQKIFKIKKEGKRKDEAEEIVEKTIVKPVEDVVAMEDQSIVEIVESPSQRVIKLRIGVEGKDGVVEEVFEEIVVKKPVEGWAESLVEEEQRALSVSQTKIQEFSAASISSDSVQGSTEEKPSLDETVKEMSTQEKDDNKLEIAKKEDAERLLKDREDKLRAEEMKRVEQEKDEVQRLKLEEAERLQKEDVERQVKDRAEKVRLENEKAERLKREEEEKLRRDEAERLQREELERQEKAAADAERSRKEEEEKNRKEESERLERIERERRDREETQRLEEEKQEAEHIKKEEEVERLRKEEAARMDRERQEREEQEKQERVQREEEERLRKEEAERLAEEERQRQEKKEKEKEELVRKEKEAERLKKEEADRLEKEELERKEREAERLRKEEAERLEKEERERKEKEAERLRKVEAERLEQEELARKGKEEERLRKEEADRLEKEELERKEKEAERLRKEEADRLEKEELERKEKAAERLRKEEAAKLEKEELERKEKEAERLRKEEAERLEKAELELKEKEAELLRKKEAERLEKEELERKEKEAERLRKEEAEKLEKEELKRKKLEAEKLHQEELARAKKEEEERLRKEEAQRLEKEETERKQEVERMKKEEEERLKKQEEERLEKEKLEREKQEAERLKREQLERQKKEEEERLKREEAERLEKEKLEREKKEEEERLEREKVAKIKQEELERKKQEDDRLEKERVARLEKEELERKKENDRLKQEELERSKKEEEERLKKEREDQLEKERLEKEKEEADRREKEKLEKEKQEAAKLKKEKLEKEKEEAAKLENERLKKEEEEVAKREKEKLEKQQVEAAKVEKEKLEKEKEEAERLKKEGVKQAEREEAERLKKKEEEELKKRNEEHLEKQKMKKLEKEKEATEKSKREEPEHQQKEAAGRPEEKDERQRDENLETLEKGKSAPQQDAETDHIKQKEAKRLKKDESTGESLRGSKKEDSKDQSRRSSKTEETKDASKRSKKEETNEGSPRTSKKEDSKEGSRRGSKKEDSKDESPRLKKGHSKDGSRRSSKIDDGKDESKRSTKGESKDDSSRISREEDSKEGSRRSSKEETCKDEVEGSKSEASKVISRRGSKIDDVKEESKRPKKDDSKEGSPRISKQVKTKDELRRSSKEEKSKAEVERTEKSSSKEGSRRGSKKDDTKGNLEPSKKQDSTEESKPLQTEETNGESTRLRKKASKDETARIPKEDLSKEESLSKKSKPVPSAPAEQSYEEDSDKTPVNSEHETREKPAQRHVRLHGETSSDQEPRSSSTIRTDSEMDSEYSEPSKSAIPRDQTVPVKSRRKRSSQQPTIEIDYEVSKNPLELRETDRHYLSQMRDDTFSPEDKHYTPHYSATSRTHEFTPGPRDRGKKPSFCTKLTDRTAAEGSRIKLTCTVLGDPEPLVYWTKDGKELPSSSNRHCTIEDNGMLSIEFYAASPKDSGEYSCVAKNVHGQAYTEAKLKVYAGYEPSPALPTFTRSIKDTYRSPENELVLECRVRGQPSPKITWLKDGQILQISDRYQQSDLGDGICRLKISRPDFYDSGLYTCRAENDSKISDCTSHVVNFDKKGTEHGSGWRGSYRNLTSSDRDTGRPKFSSYLTDHSVPAGGTIALQVEVKGVPAPDITWLRGDRREPIPAYKARTFADSGVYTLIVPEATESETGTYVCRASNAYGYVDTIANVEVVSSSSSEGGKPAMFISRPAETMIHVTDGEDVSVSFRVGGVPKPRIVWMKGLRDITNGPRSYKESSDDYVRLTLKRAQVSDEGTYCIMAKNRYGCDRTFYTVKVKQRARSLTPSPDWGTVDTDNLLTNIHDTERSYLKQVPGPITSEPVVVDGGRNWLALSWGKAVQHGPAPVVAYRVDAWLLGGEGGARWAELGITPVNAFDAFNLRPGGEYKFRITPRNRYGWGEAVTMKSSVTVREVVKFPEFSKILTGQLKALRGETLRLECEVRSESKADVKWYRDTTDIDDIHDPRYMTHCNGSKCTITVQSIKENDSGRYVCEATNTAGRVSTFARVQVVTDPKIVEADEKLRRMRTLETSNEERPPEFTMRLRDRRVQMSHPVRLTCQVSGHPEPEVTWYKNREEIFQDDNVSFWDDESHFHTLEISHSTVEDSGIYMAKARNFNGSVSCRCHLVVDKGIRAYVAPEFYRELDAVYTVKSGDELRMSAQIEAYPSVGIVWHRDSHRLRPSRSAVMTLNHDGSCELSLARVTPRDSGLYCCTATNEVGQTESTTRVSVIGSVDEELPSISQSLPETIESIDVPYSKEPLFVTKPLSTEAMEGDTVIILCEVVGDPKPEVIWLRDFLRPDYYRDAPHFRRVGAGPQYRLEIPYAKLDYTGAYSVIAKNCHGETKAIISLQIYARGQGKSDSSMEQSTVKHGKVQTLPSIKRPLRDLRCCDGDAVTLICKVHATPEPDVRWEKSGKLLPLGDDFVADFDGETARLSIQHVYPEDEGEYTCVAYNDLGKAFTSACLIVDVPEGKESALSRRLIRPVGLLSAESTPISTPRSTPIRSLSPACLSSRRELKPAPRTPRGQSIGRRPRLPIGPKFYAVPHNRVAEEGETVRFQCAIAGHPTPWVTWDKDGIPVTPTARISLKEKDDVRILEITEINHEDAGLYRITLENDVGRTEATARLEIIKGRRGSVTRTIRTRSASPRTYSIYSRSPVTSAVRGDTHLRPDIHDPMRGRGGTLSPTPSRWQYRNGKPSMESPETARRTNKQTRTTVNNGLTPTRKLPNIPIPAKPRSSSVPRRNPRTTELPLNPISQTTKIPGQRETNEENIRANKSSKTTTRTTSKTMIATKTNGSMIPKRLTVSKSVQAKVTKGDRTERPPESKVPFKEAAELKNNSETIEFLASSNDNLESAKTKIPANVELSSTSKNETQTDDQRLIVDDTKELREPTILAAPADTVALKGTKVIFLATFDGEPEPRVRWLRRGRDVRLNDKVEIETSRGMTCLTLEGVTTEQTGKYAVTLENIAGRDCRYVNLTVEGVPDPPAGTPCVQSITRSGKAIVTWRSPSYDGGCAVTGYSVEMKRAEEPCWIAVAEARHSLSHTVTGLVPEDTYRFRVRAENAHGVSEPSAVSDLVTVPGEHDEEIAGQVFTAEINQIEIEEEEEEFEPAFEARIVSLEDGRHFGERYDVMEELGKGRYGVVRRIVEKSTGLNLAAKFVRTIKSKDRQQVHEEIGIMNRLRHPKLLRLAAAFESPKEMIMVTEYISGGELFERVVADDFTLTEKDSIQFVKQICEGVEYMHTHNVVHLDLKPENIMCHTRTSHRIKLIDFGLAQTLNPDTPVRVLFGTPEFIPPEIIGFEPIGTESDMWSVGVICYVLLTGLSPFMGDNDAETFANITRADYDFDDKAFTAISLEAKDFISALLVKRKESRMSAKQCLGHPWLAQQAESMSRVALPTEKLKKFIVRRKWQKTGNAIRALGRMAILSANSRRNHSGTSSPTKENFGDELFDDVAENLDGFKPIQPVVVVEDRTIDEDREKLATSDNELGNPETDGIQSLPEADTTSEVEKLTEIEKVDDDRPNGDYIEENYIEITEIEDTQNCEDEIVDETPLIEENDELVKQEAIIDDDSTFEETCIEDISNETCEAITTDIVSKITESQYFDETTRKQSFGSFVNLEITESGYVKNRQPDGTEENTRAGAVNKENDRSEVENNNGHQEEHKDTEICMKNVDSMVNVLEDKTESREETSKTSAITKASFETNNSMLLDEEDEVTRIKRYSRTRPFVRTGSVSRTAKMFEKEDEKKSAGLIQQQKSINRTDPMLPEARPQNERIRKAFAFWNK